VQPRLFSDDDVADFANLAAQLGRFLAKRSVRRPAKMTEQRYFDAVELAVADGVLTSDEFAALCALALQLRIGWRLEPEVRAVARGRREGRRDRDSR
jgi:hypothetical protein